MTPSRLYVIGNGFDLWHGIPSTFADFKAYVRENDTALFREIEEYLPIRDNWSDLESALAEMDVEAIVDNLGHFMQSYGAEDWSDAGHHDFQYEVDKVVQLLSAGLRERFAAWIRQLAIPTSTTARRRLQTLDRSAAFLAFNYTATLQSLYGVSRDHTLFMHGCAELADDELVLGHAWHPHDRRSLNDRADIEDIDTRLMEAHQILDGYFSATFKPSAQLVEANRAFFDTLRHVREVTVLGHSLADVDAAYFRALFEREALAAARWRVACRSLDEWPDKAQQLERLGLSQAQALLAEPVLWDAV